MKKILCLGYFPASLDLTGDSIDLLIYEQDEGLMNTPMHYTSLIKAGDNLINFMNELTLGSKGRQRQFVLPQLHVNIATLARYTTHFFVKTSVEQRMNKEFPLALFLPIILIIKESKYTIQDLYNNSNLVADFAANFFNGNYTMKDNLVTKMQNNEDWCVEFNGENSSFYTDY